MQTRNCGECGIAEKHANAVAKVLQQIVNQHHAMVLCGAAWYTAASIEDAIPSRLLQVGEVFGEAALHRESETLVCPRTPFLDLNLGLVIAFRGQERDEREQTGANVGVWTFTAQA